MVGDTVVHVAVGGGPLVCPIVVAMPVGLAEIEAYPHILAAESVGHTTGEVCLCRTIRAGAGIVGVAAVEHAEAVVVLGGENHIFHTSALGGRSPSMRVEMLGVEGFVQCPIRALVVLVVGAIPIYPWFITDIPTFHDAPLGIDAPMHHKAELQILPLGDALHNGRVGFGDGVVLGFSAAQ